jgi:seryl-tRNA synthetase
LATTGDAQPLYRFSSASHKPLKRFSRSFNTALKHGVNEKGAGGRCLHTDPACVSLTHKRDACATLRAMLDIRLIREQPDFVKKRLATRGGGDEAAIDEVLRVDTTRRKAETAVQQLNADRKRLSKEIGGKRARGENADDLEKRGREIGEKVAELNNQTTALDEEQRVLLLQIPNLPHETVPVGKDPTQNVVVRTWGERPKLAGSPLDHVALGEKWQLFDLERAAKLSGSGFICFTGAGARLERALINFMLNLHTREHGYFELSPPFVVRRDSMIGTGQLPKFESDMYGLENGELFLAPTAEVPVTNFHREEILAVADLPKKFVAYTPCFRREAGSAGRETRGLIRVHQFDKVELVKISLPERSYEELESLTADAERVLQLLGLHYRIIELCTGDLGFHSAKTYDLEVWSPGQNAYFEISSCSNFEEFQARRMNLRFKDADGKNWFPHTLNGSGLALPRLFAALIETGQQPDGSIRLPEALKDYFGATEIR